jgi:hypothetical protein
MLTGNYQDPYFCGKSAFLTCFLADAEVDAFLFFFSDAELTSLNENNSFSRYALRCNCVPHKLWLLGVK